MMMTTDLLVNAPLPHHRLCHLKPSPPPLPPAVRPSAMTQLCPVSILDMVSNMAGKDPIQVMTDFETVTTCLMMIRQTTSFNDFSIEAGILLRGNGVPHAMA